MRFVRVEKILCLSALALGLSTSCGERLPLYPKANVRLGVLPAEMASLDMPLDVSPDGRILLFARRDQASATAGVYMMTMHPDSVPQFVMPIDPYLIDPTDFRFSPDASRIALVRGGGQVHIFTISNGADTAMTSPSFVCITPEWDPTGRFIAYGRPFLPAGAPDSTGGIHVLDLQAGSEYSLRHGGAVTNGARPRWSPDGEWLTFWLGTALTSGTRPKTAIHVYRARIDGAVYEDLTPGMEADHYNPIWADGGQAIMFQVVSPPRSETCKLRLSDRVRQLWPVNFLGSGLAIPTRDASRVVFAAPDPSGTFGVLYVQDVGDVTGVTRVQLTKPPA